jgi:WD40-like Beta Propeller Repeat
VRTHAKATSAIAAICGCIVVLGASASPALAAKGVVGFFGGTGVEGGQFSTASEGPGGVAINRNGTGGATAGDVYVVDRDNRRIQQFHADGTWVRAFGLNVGGPGINVCEVKANCKAAPTKESEAKVAGAMRTPQGVAIEQSTGNVYVTDQQNRRVDVFSATGAFEGAFGWNVKVTGAANELQLCTTATGCKVGAAGANAGQFGAATGYPAISPLNGHLFVADRGNLRVDEFEPTITAGAITAITFVRAYGWGVDTGASAFEICTTGSICQAGLSGSGEGQFGGANESPSALAIDATGRALVLDPTNNRVQAFSSTATPEGEFATSKLSGAPSPIDITVDPATNHVLAIKPCAPLACPGALPESERRVLELDAAGNLTETWAANAGISSASGIGAAGANAYLSTSQGAGESPGAFILGTPVPPGATIETVSTFTGTTATFEGHVHTDTLAATYHFEYSPDGATWTRIPANASEDALLPGDGAEHAVSVNATGLEAHTEYQVRLVATKAFAGGSATAQTSFTTASSPPVLSGASHSHLRDTSAQLDAMINPENEETEYHFEYVGQASFEAEGFDAAASVPVPPGSLSGGEAKEVHEQLSGLAPETAYRYRLLASNDTGDVESAVGTFTTYASAQVFEPCPNDSEFRINHPSAALPDCRAYEQASPAHKNGSNAGATVAMSKASLNGDAVTFESAAGVPGGEGAQNFPYYLATRKGGQWSTQGMLPAASAGPSAAVSGWSADLSQVFDEAKIGEEVAFLSRSSADGSLTQITPYIPPPAVGYAFQGSTAEGSKVFFSTAAGNQPLPEAAPRKVNLYAWQRGGALRLVGVLPDGTTPPQGSREGMANTSSNPYNQDNHAYAADGSSVYFTDEGTDKLYLRLNPTAPETTAKDGKGDCVPDPVLACTIQINASEKENGSGLDGHDAAGARGADFMTATPDGKVAYFTSTEKLTDDANTGEEPQPTAIARANLSDGSGKELDFLPARSRGVTVDGNYVYWIDPEAEAIGRATLDGSTEVDPDFIDIPEAEIENEPSVLESVPANPWDIAVDDEHIYWTNSVDEAGLPFVVTFQGKYAGQDVPRMTCTAIARGNCEVTAESNGGGGANERQTLTFTGAGQDTKFTLTCDGEVTAEISFFGGTGERRENIKNGLEAKCGSGNFAVSFGGGQGTIGRARIDGSPASVDPEFIEGASVPRGITVDSTHLYWASAPAFEEVGVDPGYVSRAAIDGDPASVQPEFIDVANGDVAVDAEHIYYSYQSADSGFIRRTNLDGENRESIELANPLLAGAKEGPPLAIDGSHLYFANPDTNTIGRVDLNGSGPVTNPVQLVTAAAHPEGLAVDAGHVYWSANQEVEPNPGNDLYRYSAQADSEGHHLLDVAPDNASVDGAEVQGVLGTSADGSYLYYAANGVPDGGVSNSPNANGEEAEAGSCKGPYGSASGTCNLYLWHEGETTFVARLAAGGGNLGDVSNWVPSPRVNGTFGGTYQKTARLSADGKTLLFRSQRQLTAYDNEGIPELYLYRVGEPGPICVSCSPIGAAPSGDTQLGSIQAPTIAAGAPAPILSRNLSLDGNRVFFETADALVAADVNGDEGCPQVGGEHKYPACQDVYEWEANGTGSCDSEAQNGGCLYLLSTGQSTRPSFFADASTSGGDAFLFTSEQLVRQDEDELVDVYDASAGGGLASQDEVAPVPCEGEACKAGIPAVPPSGSAVTERFSGPGNPTTAHKKAKKKKRRHRAKRRHHKKRHGRHATTTRGASR